MGVPPEHEIGAFAQAMVDQFGYGALQAALNQIMYASEIDSYVTEAWCEVASRIFRACVG